MVCSFLLYIPIKVQPRVCGEYCIPSKSENSTPGSTPRMRGIFCADLFHGIKDRFNPAYAGNMTSYSENGVSRQVHPRVCGEYYPFYVGAAVHPGSTPRMRGICTILDSTSNSIRFNPARAGNIWTNYVQQQRLQVQPRPCGEYLQTRQVKTGCVGSTPPVRGI